MRRKCIIQLTKALWKYGALKTLWSPEEHSNLLFFHCGLNCLGDIFISLLHCTSFLRSHSLAKLICLNSCRLGWYKNVIIPLSFHCTIYSEICTFLYQTCDSKTCFDSIELSIFNLLNYLNIMYFYMEG